MGNQCQHCGNGWVGEVCDRVHEPYPNYGTTSYLHVRDTHTVNEDGEIGSVNLALI